MPLVLSGNLISISSFFAPFFTLRRRPIIHWCSGEKVAIIVLNTAAVVFFQLKKNIVILIFQKQHPSRLRRSSSRANGCNLLESLSSPAVLAKHYPDTFQT